MKDKVKQYLEERKLMALATYDKNHPWICNVYYVIDEDLNFYFKSSFNSIHIQQILQNDKVALTVADSNQSLTSARVAIQLHGQCERLTDIDKITWFLNKWTDTPAKYDPKDLANGNEAGVFKIRPEKLKYFNTDLPDEKHFIFINL